MVERIKSLVKEDGILATIDMLAQNPVLTKALLDKMCVAIAKDLGMTRASKGEIVLASTSKKDLILEFIKFVATTQLSTLQEALNHYVIVALVDDDKF